VAEVLAEKGGIATLELTAGPPGLSGKKAFGNNTWGQVLQFSAFVDYADGRMNPPFASTEDNVVNLAGAGGSIQFTVPGHVFSRLDVATPLTGRVPSNGRHVQYYFRLGMTY
jgi:hemolysin activation/secretion protein